MKSGIQIMKHMIQIKNISTLNWGKPIFDNIYHIIHQSVHFFFLFKINRNSEYF